MVRARHDPPNKTGYGNAVWQLLGLHRTGSSTQHRARKTSTQQRPEAQGQSVMRKSLRCRTRPDATIRPQSTLEDAASADAVIVGSGIGTRQIVGDRELMSRLSLEPGRQLIGSQCSGALILAKLGLLGDIPACTDLTPMPWVLEAGVEVLNQSFFARGNVATASGCLASCYLAGWIIARSLGIDAATEALHYVAPVGEKEAFVANALKNIEPYLNVVTPTGLTTY